MEKRVFKDKQGKQYPSKIGMELLILVLVILGSSFFFVVKESSWSGLAIILPTLAFVIYIFYSISYEIKGNTLVIECGIFYKKRIVVETIKKIVETNNPISAPAASLDRLEIWYNTHSSVLVSPKDKIGFIEHLKALSPEIEVQMKKQKQKSD